ncbi:MAG TPA: indoleacetamide hydrolase [Steroidobacteraceae bacterium]|nr:indoleacetamide hydrolase [Steroidobacteraceae bacterium]
MPLEELTVRTAAAMIRRGELTAESYVAELLERCAAAEALNAFASLDAERALAAARQADEHRSAGAPLGPLHGVPLVLKDNLDTADLATTGGTPALRGNRPRSNGAVVQRLLDAGAILLGKTNMHELAFGVTNHNAAFGPARNPYDLARIPGGSSGGTGVAVAARLAPAGIGTDTGGSVRVPAALCGIVGFRPTTGRWSQSGIIPISHTRDTAGPMTRNIADASLLDSIVTGEEMVPALASLRGVRLGVPRAYFYDDLDADVARTTEALLARLDAAGAVLVEGEVRRVGELDLAAGFPIALYEAIGDLNRYLQDHEIGVDLEQLVSQVASPDVREILSGALGRHRISEDVYADALLNHRPALQQSYRRFFAELDVMAAILPTTPRAAARIGEDMTCELNGRQVPTFTTFTRNTAPGSLAGIPGVSLPAGYTLEGLPIGIALDGPADTDRALLALAAAIEPLMPALPRPSLPAEPSRRARVKP